MVIRALVADHDPFGIFGPPRKQAAVDPKDLRMEYHDYLALLLELRDLALELEPGLQVACDKMELVGRGPAASRCGCDRCRTPLDVVDPRQDSLGDLRTASGAL